MEPERPEQKIGTRAQPSYMSEAVVIVENLTRVADLKGKLQEFLGFCGGIDKITIQCVFTVTVSHF